MPVFHDVDQGSPEWLKLRIGIPTGDIVKTISEQKQTHTTKPTSIKGDLRRLERAVNASVVELSGGANII